MKKVYHIALSNPIFPNGGWQKAFEDNNFEYYSVNWQSSKRVHGQEQMWQRIFSECEKIKPDLIFSQIQTPDVLTAQYAKEISKIAFTINYTMDVREELGWYERIAPYMGLLLFCDYESVEQMKGKGFDNVDILQSSADFNLYKPLYNE